MEQRFPRWLVAQINHPLVSGTIIAVCACFCVPGGLEFDRLPWYSLSTRLGVQSGFFGFAVLSALGIVRSIYPRFAVIRLLLAAGAFAITLHTFPALYVARTRFFGLYPGEGHATREYLVVYGAIGLAVLILIGAAFVPDRSGRLILATIAALIVLLHAGCGYLWVTIIDRGEVSGAKEVVHRLLWSEFVVFFWTAILMLRRDNSKSAKDEPVRRKPRFRD